MFTKREELPRCGAMDGSSLRIVPAYTEAGLYMEANCVTITDGVRTAVYIPLADDDSQLASFHRDASK